MTGSSLKRSHAPGAATGLFTLVLVAVSLLTACEGSRRLAVVEVVPNLEDRMPDGSLYSSATISFLRGHHWLDRVDRIEIEIAAGYLGTLTISSSQDHRTLTLASFPLGQLVPRFHYQPRSPADEFDAYNLMMAEYSRNGLSVPTGNRGDTIAHFESAFSLEIPWVLDGDYNFIPNQFFRPFRVAVVNNCLQAGLWELTASDRAGELYHGWFTLPKEAYIGLVAKVNGIDEELAAKAIEWSTREPRLDLDRLREEGASLGKAPLTLAGEGLVGYSSQDSRQKIARGFVRVQEDGRLTTPRELGELISRPVSMTSFVAPGKYSLQERKEFDLTFLGRPGTVRIRRVKPRTHYDWRRSKRPPQHAGTTHLEMRLDFGDRQIILGNLPLSLLVQQEDYVIHGFGVGILPAAGLAERRRFLIEEGPAPSYAYLVVERDGEVYGLNSHDTGIEQIFLRTNAFARDPHWEITISSYERIVDLAKYRVGIPADLVEELRRSSTDYVSPLYFSYRDDNVR